MIGFKQTIGRGTRLYEGKDYFTIYDFVKIGQHFNNPNWDSGSQDPNLVTIDGQDDKHRLIHLIPQEVICLYG